MTSLKHTLPALAWLALAALPMSALAESQTAVTEVAAEEEPAVVEMTLGNPDAAVTLMEYASFTCGHCATFHANQFKQLKAEYIDTGKINFVYRDVYFDRVGLWAAMVARCESDRFFGVSDLIYSKQGEWMNSQDPVVLAANLRKMGKIAGLEEDKIKACMEDGDKAKALVDWFQANTAADDINATPTLIINGEKYKNMSYEKLKAILDEKLGS
ncbi:DsbA family protein [Alisedimentitalea sp. MJ-SS2]|uniref:DsbA family protein n=1 Tax=Aliisedimentitalea sp. MJ-SS2 TaxID=3049795 RepID=UPI0029157D36|nr:DsbA family protein [Alisedimentitalea sp. MJ-SS2]MDU8928063.1 DsbA family protein [Alisedimentitalea sp. MJ-SS2]